MKNSDNLSIRSIRKKILLMSKVIGAVLVISYILSTKLPFPSNISLSIWTVFVALLIFAVDFLMSCFISKPIAKLEKAAKRMADLDFSSTCDIMTNDEFGRLSTGGVFCIFSFFGIFALKLQGDMPFLNQLYRILYH